MPKVTGKDLLRLARDAKKMQLQAVRLAEASCKLGTLRPNQLPTKATQSGGFGVFVDRENMRIVARVGFKITSAYDEAPGESEPAIMVAATFDVHYSLLKPLSKASTERAARATSLVVAWPYWRELVQSMTVRMGLPALPVPLFSITDIPGEA